MRTGSGVDIQQIVAHLDEPVDVERLIEGWRYAMRPAPDPANVVSMVGLPAAAAGSAATGRLAIVS